MAGKQDNALRVLVEVFGKEKAQQVFNDIANSGKQSATAIAFSFNEVSDALARIKVIGDKAFAFFERGGTVGGMEAGFKRLVGDQGLLVQLQKASDNTVQRLDLIRVAEEGIARGILPQHLTLITQTANNMSDSLGTDLLPTLDRLQYAVGTGNLKAFASLGVNVRELRREFGEGQLTYEETIEVMSRVRDMFGENNGDGAADSVNALRTAVIDLGDAIASTSAQASQSTGVLNWIDQITAGITRLGSAVSADSLKSGLGNMIQGLMVMGIGDPKLYASWASSAYNWAGGLASGGDMDNASNPANWNANGLDAIRRSGSGGGGRSGVSKSSGGRSIIGGPAGMFDLGNIGNLPSGWIDFLEATPGESWRDYAGGGLSSVRPQESFINLEAMNLGAIAELLTSRKQQMGGTSMRETMDRARRRFGYDEGIGISKEQNINGVVNALSGAGAAYNAGKAGDNVGAIAGGLSAVAGLIDIGAFGAAAAAGPVGAIIAGVGIIASLFAGNPHQRQTIQDAIPMKMMNPEDITGPLNGTLLRMMQVLSRGAVAGGTLYLNQRLQRQRLRVA